MSTVLIGYISKSGSTKEIAEEISKILTQRGFSTTLQPLSDINHLDGYSAMIIGAPINGFQWLPEAVKFIEDHKGQLEKIQVAYFIVSYLIKAGRESVKKTMRGTLEKAKSIVKPISTGYFGGKVDGAFPTLFRFMFGVKKGTPADVRDWDEVRKWAEELSVTLKK